MGASEPCEAGLERMELGCWDAPVDPADSLRAVDTIESGRILLLPLPFELAGEEQDLFASGVEGRRKNVSYDPARRRVRGGDSAQSDLLAAVLGRYHGCTRRLALNLFAPYASALQDGRTSFRPAQIQGRRPKSWRKDDRRLHVDAFPATPVQGRRMLRFFTNINPDGEARQWNVGEPFADVARRFFPRLAAPSPLRAGALAALGLTKSLRSDYDHYMLQLHDRMKADSDYQAHALRSAIEFAAGETWVLFSDQVSHAVLRGRFLLEQTFYLPVEVQARSQSSPLKVLESLAGYRLVR